MRDIALIGKKIGMTREFYKTGQSVPVTVLKMEKARVIQVIDSEKRGYKASELKILTILKREMSLVSKYLRI
jgi:large subunit ribosomal protein L3